MVRPVPVAVAEQTQEADNSSCLFPSESSSCSLHFPSFLPQSSSSLPLYWECRSAGGFLRPRTSGLFWYQSIKAARGMLSEADMWEEEGLPLWLLWGLVPGRQRGSQRSCQGTANLGLHFSNTQTQRLRVWFTHCPITNRIENNKQVESFSAALREVQFTSRSVTFLDHPQRSS